MDEQCAAGVARPVFIGGVRYHSVFEAAFETDISTVWISKKLKASCGYPVLIKRHMVVTENWGLQRIASYGDKS